MCTPGKESLVKHQRVSKYYESDCSIEMAGIVVIIIQSFSKKVYSFRFLFLGISKNSDRSLGIIFEIFLNRTKLKIVSIKITTFFKRCVSIIL